MSIGESAGPSSLNARRQFAGRRRWLGVSGGFAPGAFGARACGRPPPNFVFDIIAQSIYSLKPTLLRASFERNFGGAGPAEPPPYSRKWSLIGDLFAVLHDPQRPATGATRVAPVAGLLASRDGGHSARGGCNSSRACRQAANCLLTFRARATGQLESHPSPACELSAHVEGWGAQRPRRVQLKSRPSPACELSLHVEQCHCCRKLCDWGRGTSGEKPDWWGTINRVGTMDAHKDR